MYVRSQSDDIYGDVWTEEKAYCVEVEVHRVQDAEDLLFSPWREVSWTEKKREELRENLTLYKPSFEALSKVRVLLLGPVGAGKSSFINSIRSVLYRRVSLLPIIGSVSEGFTKKLKCYDIRAEKGGQPTALTLCDAMGFGDSEGTGMTLHDTLAVIKGHVPEGHKFQSEASINFNTPGYRQSPAMEDTVHCAVFVLDACKVLSYSENLEKKLKKLHRMISDLGIPHVVLLTHVDQVCHAVQEDVQYVYTSRIVQERMQKAAELVGLPLSFVYPIKNYASEVSVNCNTDILLLSAVNQILQAIDDASEDYPSAPQEAETKR
ncbi:interferon-induced protein 44-like [Megalops cyprinoides]|uniref:interferon-induced protein 44-like n=1 Tax=Megalops cyprinoides TaxID=118141 RepID=UPI0018656402|nr:interferon-induced protein 44-like [Megalops cyprinoides]